MSRGGQHLFFFSLAALVVSVSAQPVPAPIVLNGDFSDWRTRPVAIADPRDARGAAVDIREVRVDSDDSFVHLFVDLEREVNLQALDGTLSLVVDADGDPETGTRQSDLPGADFALDFSPHGADGQPGAGVGLRVFAGNTGDRTPYDVGAAAQPSYASRRFELRIQRGRALGAGLRLFQGPHWSGRLVFTDLARQIRDETAIFTAPLSARGVPDGVRPAPVPVPSAGTPGSFRIAGWNVARQGLFERTERFTRPLAAIAPDILALDEVSGSRTAAEIRAVIDTVRPSQAWQIAAGDGGGQQRAVVASRFPIEPVPELQRIAYPPGVLADLRRHFSSTAVDKELDEAARDGLAAFGALVRIDTRRLLVVVVDLRCCGRMGSFEDALRIAEAETIRTQVRRVRARLRYDGAIVIGDFNLVGRRRPLETMMRGLDRDGSSLALAPALQLDGRSAATWRDAEPRPSGPIFTPGRLDYVLFGDATLALERALVFDSAQLPVSWAEAHGVQSDDNHRASDHLPVVADFRWRAGQ